MTQEDREEGDRLQKINETRREIKKRLKIAQGVTVRHANKFIINRWSSVLESQRHIAKWILAMAVLIAATGLQLSWYQRSYQTTAAAESGTYAEAVLGPINTLNPIFADSSAELSASSLLFSRLLYYDKSGHLNYDIVKNISVNSDQTLYTLTIRPDIKWHDGQKLTADDIAFTIGLIKNPIVRSSISGFDNITVKAVNDNTIEFSMPNKNITFQHLLTFPILPKHLLGNIEPVNIRENEFNDNPIGSGPFKINYIQDVDTESGKRVVYLVKNDDYYGGRLKLGKFQLRAYSTSDDIAKAINLNEVNAATDLSPLDVAKIDKKKFVIKSKPIQSGVYAIFNTTGQLLQDINIRRALQLATNTQKIRDDLGVGSPGMDLPFTNNQLFGDIPKAQAFDLDAARRTLNDNGWVLNNSGIREKGGKELKLSIVSIKDDELEKVLGIIVGQWRQVGVVAETKVVDPNDVAQNVVQTILQPRSYDVLLYRLTIGADPDVYAYWHSSQASSSGLNFANYSNQISDDALSSARDRSEADLRNAKYLTFARQWLADVPAVGLYQSTIQYVHTNEVGAFDDSNVLISSVDRYNDILNWSAGTREVYKTP